MTKLQRMRLTVFVQFVLFVIVALAGLFMVYKVGAGFFPKGFLFSVHKYGVILLILSLLVHVFDNRAWIHKIFTGK